jgi:hypothetical protein
MTEYVNVEELKAALNANYDQASGNYTVYGLTISENTFQAHVEYANTYVESLLGCSLNQTDPRFPTAKMAALDLACLRVLVVSSGGAMTGAFDYFMGDLRVARAGPYAEAIERTIRGLREDFHRQLVNLTKPAVAAEATAAEEVPTYRGGLIA